MIRAALTFLILLTANVAFACPQCALNQRAGLGSWFILPAMILFPFILVGVVLYMLRKTTILATEQENLDAS